MRQDVDSNIPLPHQMIAAQIQHAVGQLPAVDRRLMMESIQGAPLLNPLLTHLMRCNEQQLFQQLSNAPVGALAGIRDVYMATHMAFGVLEALTREWTPEKDEEWWGRDETVDPESEGPYESEASA
jgi:hypothetical protein